jgi:hypothetical protein
MSIWLRCMQQKTVTDSWLLVSTESFRMQRASREPGPVGKAFAPENRLDADPPRVDFNIAYDDQTKACGSCAKTTKKRVEDLDKMRCVFWTSKTDSHLKRARMGRGFNENCHSCPPLRLNGQLHSPRSSIAIVLILYSFRNRWKICLIFSPSSPSDLG